MQEEFKQNLIKTAQLISKRAASCTNEEMSKQSLILPFLQFLGYDVFDPEEVVPEHAADFCEKYKNRIDYVIVKEKAPVIGIECKILYQKMTKANCNGILMPLFLFLWVS